MKCLILLVCVIFVTADTNSSSGGYSPDVSVRYKQWHVGNAILIHKNWAIASAHNFTELSRGVNNVTRVETIPVTSSTNTTTNTTKPDSDVDDYDELYRRRSKRSTKTKPWKSSFGGNSHPDNFFANDDFFTTGLKHQDGAVSESRSEEEEEETEFNFNDKDEKGNDDEDGQVRIRKKKSKHEKVFFGNNESPASTTSTPTSNHTNTSISTPSNITSVNVSQPTQVNKTVYTNVTVYDYQIYSMFYNDETSAPLETVAIVEILIHEGFSALSGGGYTNDLALIHLQDSDKIYGDGNSYPGYSPTNSSPYFISWVNGTDRIALWRDKDDFRSDGNRFSMQAFRHFAADVVPFQAGGSTYINGSAEGLYTYTNASRYYFTRLSAYTKWIQQYANITQHL